MKRKTRENPILNKYQDEEQRNANVDPVIKPTTAKR